jgi:hypothetical protein
MRGGIPVLLEEVDDVRRGIEGLIGGLSNAVKEELEPGFPSTALAHLLQEPVIVGAARFEIEAQVEERRAQHAVHAKVQRHEEMADAPVAVKERVDRLELDVKEPGFDEGWQLRLVLMQVSSLK